jgi:hypothetical protein
MRHAEQLGRVPAYRSALLLLTGSQLQLGQRQFAAAAPRVWSVAENPPNRQGESMAGDIFERDLITYDPLSETTRKERTSLLGISMLGVALVKVPLVPEKFSALGVDFSKVNQSTFVKLYALVVTYYVIAFAIYALTDYLAWRRQEVIHLHEYNRRNRERLTTEKVNSNPEVDAEIEAAYGDHLRAPGFHGLASYWLAFSAARFRAVFEFLLPVVFAGYTLLALLSYTPSSP